MPFKICVIGCGNMSRYVHGDSFKKYAQEHPGTELAGCCDLDPERAEAYRACFGFQKAYTDYAAMLNEVRPDAVSVISPVHITKDLSCSVLEMGYPVIAEKPPGLNVEEAKAIAEQSQKCGKLALAAFNRRYSPLIAKAREIAEGFPSVDSLYYSMVRYRRFDADFSTTSIHAIDAVRSILGEDYKTVDFDYKQVEGQESHVCSIYMNAVMGSGCRVRIELAVSAGVESEHFIVNGPDNTLMVSLAMKANPRGSFRHFRDAELVESFSHEEGAPAFITQGFYDENRNFFDMVKSGADNSQSDIEKAYQSVILADCIRKRIKHIAF